MYLQGLASFVSKGVLFLQGFFLLDILFDFNNNFCSCNNAFIFALLWKAKLYCSIETHTLLRVENGCSLFIF